MKKQIGIVLSACLCVCGALASFAAADTMPRSEWHAKVSDCAQNPQTLKLTIGQLSAADQLAFLGEVNEAISKLPGSDEVRGAKFYAANRAAVTGATKENRAAVLAQVFATVPPEFLTDINERFATELFNRNANPDRRFTDEEFTLLSKSAMEAVIAQCQKAENNGVREMFAVLMFVRASDGTPKNLAETLIAMMPDEKNRELAGNEWLKPALGQGQDQTYDPMLGAAQAGEEPNHAVVLQLTAGFQIRDALLADLRAESSVDTATPTPALGAGVFEVHPIVGTGPGTGINRVPRAYIENPLGIGGTAEGPAEENPYFSPGRGQPSGGGSSGGGGGEPHPYRGQGI